MKVRKIGVALSATLALAAWANADSIKFCDTVDLQRTNWLDSVTIQKFDSNLGTLTSILFELSGHVEGSAAFESLDSEPATVDMSLQAEIALQRPDNSVLVTVLPTANTSDNVTAFDGVIDFGGTSGKSYNNLSADDSNSAVSPPPASDLVLFTGAGTINLPVDAMALSNGSGAGNLILQFQTFASAEVCVTYNYRPTNIPEPTAMTLGGLGLSLAAMLRRRS